MTIDLDHVTQPKVDIKNDDSKRSVFSIHRFLLMISLTLIFAFVFVMGISYFYNGAGYKGQSGNYLCPNSTNKQAGLCLKS